MKLREWEQLPRQMRQAEVRPYYELLKKRTGQLCMKKVFDTGLAWILLVLLSPVMLVLAAWIYQDSGGPVFYRQTRVTQYGRTFKIYKFRTMVPDADKKGTAVTVAGDSRITKSGAFLRKTRLDELPQLFNIVRGEMSFVGTRPEVPQYVEQYTKKMQATLLLPAGVTSLASIKFKDEAKLLDGVEDINKIYVGQILPEKMKWNLRYLRKFSFWRDIKIMLDTVVAVFL